MNEDIPYVDRLREQLLDAAARQAVSRGSWRPPARAGRLLLVALLLVSVGVPLYALRGLGSRPTAETEPGASSDATPAGRPVVTTTKLEPGILSLTAAFGDVWVVRVGDTGGSPPLGRVIRVDGATGAVEATIRIDTVERLEELARITEAGGLIWVSEGRGDGPQTISAIDPALNRVVRAVTVPGPVEGLAALRGELWASVASPPGGALVQIDPASARVVRTLTVPGAGSLGVAGDSLWIHSSLAGGSSVQVDPATGTVGTRLEGTVGNVVSAGGLYWWISVDRSDPEGTTIRGIDPGTGETVAILPAPRAADLVPSDAGIWILSIPGELPGGGWDPSRPATVSLIDPAARAYLAGPVPLGDPPFSIAAAGDAAWITHYTSGEMTTVALGG